MESASNTDSNTDKEPSKWQERCTTIMVIVGAIAGLVMLILAIIAYAQIAGFVNDYNAVINTWQETPISDFSFGTAGVCPSGWSALQSYFPSIYDACNCDGPGHGNSTSSDTSSCTSQQLSDNCVTRPTLFPNPTPVYIFPGRPLCHRRQGPSALDRTQDPDRCQQNERVCGEGAGRICWPNDIVKCPITDFAISATQYNQQDAGADEVPELITNAAPLGNYYLYVKRGGQLNATHFGSRASAGGSLQETGLPLTDLRFQVSDPCTLSGCGYGGRGSEHAAMVALYKANFPANGYQPRSYDCDGGCLSPDVSNSVSPNGRDIRFLRVFARQERDVFLETTTAPGNVGPVPSEFIVGASANYPWYTEYRSEVIWTLTCPESRDTVVSRETDVESVRKAQLALLILGIISFIFLSIIFPCIEICAKDKAKKYYGYNCYCKITVKGAILGCTLATVIIAYSTLAFWSSINGQGDKAACSDPLTSETFRVLGDKFASLSYKNAISTASSGATSAGDVILFGLQRCGRI